MILEDRVKEFNLNKAAMNRNDLLEAVYLLDFAEILINDLWTSLKIYRNAKQDEHTVRK